MKKLSYPQRVAIYEREKQRLQNENLSYKEYEAAVRKLIRELGI